MGINLRLSASASGTANTFDQTVNFVSTYSGASGGSGATNDAALSAFNTAYAGFSGRTRLVIPAGDYTFASEVQFGLLGGSGNKLTIDAAGATLRMPVTTNGFARGGFYTDNLHHANINTIVAGNSTVTLVTSGQTSRFSVGQWVAVTEGDLQGFGYPPNPWKFEFKKIQSIGTGTLTFTESLSKSYSSTYPNYAAGDAGNIYLGGPATVYAMSPSWDQEIEIRGAYITDTSNLFYGKCRVAKYTDCTFDTYGPTPTVNLSCIIRRCTTIATELEVDKCVESLEMYDNNLHAIVFQSLGVNNLIATNNTIASGQYWRGSANNSVITNLSTPTYTFGLFAYGTLMGSTSLVSCNASSAGFFNSYRQALSAFGQPGGGSLTITQATPVTFAVPGAWCVLLDASGNFSGISFQITNIAFSGGVTTISTTLSTPVPGTSGGFSAPWYIHPHPGKDTTLITCTGNSVFTTASANPPNSPIFGWS